MDMSGFQNPYALSEFVTSEGLIRTLELAREAFVRFSEIYQVEDLEIVYAKTWNGVQHNFEPPPSFHLLGYDVAGDAPFWSIVGDCPPLSDPNLGQSLSRINANGLFESGGEAIEYLSAHNRYRPEGRDQGLRIWQVYVSE
jgi:hypothetical protein